jgi:hypothetical protein
MDELYNLRTDPYELKNLINAPAARNGLRLMRQELARLFRLGKDLNMIFLAGEVVVDYDFRLRRELELPGKTWVVGYTNDVLRYIASRRVREEGGYEASTSMIYYGLPGPWAPGVEEVLVSKVRKMAGK